MDALVEAWPCVGVKSAAVYAVTVPPAAAAQCGRPASLTVRTWPAVPGATGASAVTSAPPASARVTSSPWRVVGSCAALIACRAVSALDAV